MTEKEKQAKAVEEMNARVGYQVPLCYATLNTIVINEETDMGEIPLIEKRTAMAVIAEVIANTHGGRLTLDAVADIMQACIAYGWHWAREGESMLRSEFIEARLKECLKRKVPSVLTVNEYAERVEELERGFGELRKVVEKVEHGIRLQRQMKVKS